MKEKYKILILESFHGNGIELLKKNQFKVDIQIGLVRKEQLKIIHKYDVIIIKSLTQVDDEFLKKAKRLKLIARAGVGLDNINLNLSKELGIKVINVPGGNSDAVADFTVMQILCLVRNAYKAQEMIKKKDFRRSLLMGRDLKNLVIGVIGYGKIGKKVVKRLSSFGSIIYVLDKKIKNKKNQKNLIFCNSLKKVLKVSDIITFHIPLNHETYNLINKKEIKLMKKNVYLINTSRGDIINTNSILRNKKNIFFATDVLDREPPMDSNLKNTNYKNKLLNKKNIIITPHIASSTHDTQKFIAGSLAKKIINFKKNLVNLM